MITVLHSDSSASGENRYCSTAALNASRVSITRGNSSGRACPVTVFARTRPKRAKHSSTNRRQIFIALSKSTRCPVSFNIPFYGGAKIGIGGGNNRREFGVCFFRKIVYVTFS